MTKERKELGERGEFFACTYLERQGIQVLDRNWRCKAGEADIIAIEDDDVVFLEVKTRRMNTETGLPEDAITAAKRKRYERIAESYLFHHDLPSARIRFDVIAISVSDDGKALLRHHRDAFCCGA